MHKGIIAAGIAAAVAVAGYVAYQQLTKPPYALEVDATKDTTDISGIQYRIRVTNVGTEQLTGITVVLGEKDVQEKPSLNPGETYFFYPDPETRVSVVQVTANEGISVKSDYRSPTKVLGLPGGGR
ncbi:MAG TPA: hypothetical protein VHK86_06545 [Nitrososphaera sp.]|jgi:hypothetical protein|nr:hypothetical protein [Nitrososphaera sp.]